MVVWRVFDKNLWGKLPEETTERSTYLYLKHSTHPLAAFLSYRQQED